MRAVKWLCVVCVVLDSFLGLESLLSMLGAFLVDKFCYLGDMLSVDGDADQLWRPEFELDGINSGS